MLTHKEVLGLTQGIGLDWEKEMDNLQHFADLVYSVAISDASHTAFLNGAEERVVDKINELSESETS